MDKLINLAIEYQKLNNSYGFLSCLDYPKEYEQMDSLQEQLDSMIHEFTDNTDISWSGLSDAVNSLASDIIAGNIFETANIALYSKDQFIDFLSKTMTYKEAERFKDMLNWMQPSEEAGYLHTRFILEFENDRNNKNHYYHDDMMSFVIIVK